MGGRARLLLVIVLATGRPLFERTTLKQDFLNHNLPDQLGRPPQITYRTPFFGDYDSAVVDSEVINVTQVAAVVKNHSRTLALSPRATDALQRPETATAVVTERKDLCLPQHLPSKSRSSDDVGVVNQENKVIELAPKCKTNSLGASVLLKYVTELCFEESPNNLCLSLDPTNSELKIMNGDALVGSKEHLAIAEGFRVYVTLEYTKGSGDVVATLNGKDMVRGRIRPTMTAIHARMRSAGGVNLFSEVSYI